MTVLCGDVTWPPNRYLSRELSTVIFRKRFISYKQCCVAAVMTVTGERTSHQTGVLNITPLKRSASFTISVDKVGP